MNIGWIGLGAMGLPMAACIAGAGQSVTAFDVNSAVRVPAGVPMRIVGSSAEAVADADAVIVMVATPDQARSVIDGADGIGRLLRKESLLMVTATVGAALMESLSEELAPRGVLVVDAPVSGGVARAADGQLLAMASGAPDALDKAAPILDALSDAIYIVGDRPGDAQRMKLVNQLLCGVHIVAAAEALAFAEMIGIDPRLALTVVSSGAAASFMLGDRGPRMLEEPDSVRSAVDIFVKDLNLVLGEADRDGAFPLAAAALARFQAAHDAGLGRHDDSMVIRTYVKEAPAS